MLRDQFQSQGIIYLPEEDLQDVRKKDRSPFAYNKEEKEEVNKCMGTRYSVIKYIYSPTLNTEAAHKFRTLHQVYGIHLTPTTRLKPQQHQTEQYCKSPVIYLMVKHGLYIYFVNKKIALLPEYLPS